jgi:hypothetical protein
MAGGVSGHVEPCAWDHAPRRGRACRSDRPCPTRPLTPRRAQQAAPLRFRYHDDRQSSSPHHSLKTQKNNPHEPGVLAHRDHTARLSERASLSSRRSYTRGISRCPPGTIELPDLMLTVQGCCLLPHIIRERESVKGFHQTFSSHHCLCSFSLPALTPHRPRVTVAAGCGNLVRTPLPLTAHLSRSQPRRCPQNV